MVEGIMGNIHHDTLNNSNFVTVVQEEILFELALAATLFLAEKPVPNPTYINCTK